MNSIICRPILLPVVGQITDERHPGICPTTGSMTAETHCSDGNIYWNGLLKPQHLYLVSDREIKEGDYISDPSEYYSVYKSASNYKGTKLLKVEATTDKSLNLPLIPQSFIQEWVDKQGKIDKVRLKSSYECIDLVTRGNIKGDPNWVEVVILPTKDSWNREEVKEIAEEAWIGGVHFPDLKKFNEWFDKTY